MSMLILKLYSVKHINLKIQLDDASAHPLKHATHIEKQDTYSIEITKPPFQPPPILRGNYSPNAPQIVAFPEFPTNARKQYVHILLFNIFLKFSCVSWISSWPLFLLC